MGVAVDVETYVVHAQATLMAQKAADAAAGRAARPRIERVLDSLAQFRLSLSAYLHGPAKDTLTRWLGEADAGEDICTGMRPARL